MHEAGYVHCDLKPENILLGSDDFSDKSSSRIVLIDFGIALAWEKPDDFQHVGWEKIDEFRGNCLFASHNSFRGYTLSRRDDLISLAYLLSFLVTGRFLWMGEEAILDDKKLFQKVRDLKVKIRP